MGKACANCSGGGVPVGRHNNNPMKMNEKSSVLASLDEREIRVFSRFRCRLGHFASVNLL